MSGPFLLAFFGSLLLTRLPLGFLSLGVSHWVDYLPSTRRPAFPLVSHEPSPVLGSGGDPRSAGGPGGPTWAPAVVAGKFWHGQARRDRWPASHPPRWTPSAISALDGKACGTGLNHLKSFEIMGSPGWPGELRAAGLPDRPPGAGQARARVYPGATQGGAPCGLPTTTRVGALPNRTSRTKEGVFPAPPRGTYPAVCR